MTITRPSSKAVISSITGLLDIMWDRFFNDVQVSLNNIQLNTNFTMDAAASKAISDKRITANSHISLTPTNVAAANLMLGASSLYISARTAGVSFTVHTASGSAGGTETFSYSILG
jgi:hypothetical protein